MMAFIIKQPIRTIYLNQHYGSDFIEAGSDERWKVDKIRLMAR